MNMFDQIYGTDLVYVPDCWKLCKDAHCCSFQRYKARFRIIGAKPAQELPLLPGEYEYLEEHGYLEQFKDFDHRVLNYSFGSREIKIESIVSRRPNCACDHDTRTTICRLYPLMPVYDVTGRLLGTDKIGTYEVLEQEEGLNPACMVTGLPFEQLSKFLAIASAISSNPKALFYISAYRLANRHLQSRIATLKKQQSGDAFAIFEMNLLRGKLIDWTQLEEELVTLADSFAAKYGDDFLCQ
jgi:hypothetical protein